jgi:hypothetical protein
MITLEPFALAGFEPGSTDPEADAMSTAPSRQGYLTNCLFSVKYRLNFWPDVE